MDEIALAFVWHQHQPYYPDDVGGTTLMPWVRLHGVKDYVGMALHLKEVPEFRCTINLVPCLLLQLRRYVEQGAEDYHWQLSRRAADALSEAEALYLLDHFFMAHTEHMIRPHHRYYELYVKRNAVADTAKRALRRFSETDLRDLQVWWNLAWIHPLVVEHDRGLQELFQKGRHFTEEEKYWLLEQHRQILARIIPLHRELAEAGQVELTTTPFYHPILPLLWDKRLAREAMPDVALPRFLHSYREDAELHIRRAVDYHQEVFGQRPRGLWPSEGSVCPQMIPALAEAGIEWIATDEEILNSSLDGGGSRDGFGHLRNPELLYRPWRVGQGDRWLTVVFRDHALSDLIGFHYQRMASQRAVDDFVGRLDAIGHAMSRRGTRQPALVPVILDGENCWEHYPGNGVEFRRLLFRRCASHPKVQPVRVSDYLGQWPATETLPRLASGSWIHHNFAIWIGHEEDNRAWDLLHQSREQLREAQRQRRASPEQLQKAWEEIYIAEGSDWFWWFGDDHTSAQDTLFDALFRKHLQNAYQAIDLPVPVELQQSISLARRRRLYTEPRGFLDVKVDGRHTFFEWIHAGRYICRGDRGAMSMATSGRLKELSFGFSPSMLLLRVDTHGPVREELADVDTLRAVFLEPAGYELVVKQPGSAEPPAQLYYEQQPQPAKGIQVASDQVLEIAIALQALGAGVETPIHFFVELWKDDQSLDRAPRDGAVELNAPSADYEQIMWQA